MIDVVAMDLEAGQIRGIQATSGSSAAARVTKMLAEDRVRQWLS